MNTLSSALAFTALLLVVASGPLPLGGQERPEAHVAPATDVIQVDGRLDESDWGRAVPLGPLTTIEPVEGGSPVAATVVRVLADAANLYIGVRALDPEPTGIVSYSKARDSQLRSEDHVKLILDPYLDGRSGYVFAVNPRGLGRRVGGSHPGDGGRLDGGDPHPRAKPHFRFVPGYVGVQRRA
jgi:hypothetical protein